MRCRLKIFPRMYHFTKSLKGMSHASSRHTSLGITQNLWYAVGYLILLYLCVLLSIINLQWRYDLLKLIKVKTYWTVVVSCTSEGSLRCSSPCSLLLVYAIRVVYSVSACYGLLTGILFCADSWEFVPKETFTSFWITLRGNLGNTRSIAWMYNKYSIAELLLQNELHKPNI